MRWTDRVNVDLRETGLSGEQTRLFGAYSSLRPTSTQHRSGGDVKEEEEEEEEE